ncbi:MAG: hypothetical protein L0H94_05320 [Nitrospira sp.]|nr:hypothetical protein [Nitrospira sp.]
MKQALKGFNGCAAIAEGREWFGDFFYFGFFHDLKSAPITGEPFKEVIAFHIAVVICPRDVGRIEVHKVNAAGLQLEYIGTSHSMAPAVIEDDGVEDFDLLKKMFFDGEAEITASVIIAIAGERKYAARLFLKARAKKCCAGDGLSVGMIEVLDSVRNAIEEAEIWPGVKHARKGTLDEIWRILDWVKKCLESWAVEMEITVFDCRGGQRGWKIKEVRGYDALAHCLEKVTD